jgi:selenocysteine lyase/cysteine desulfurase
LIANKDAKFDTVIEGGSGSNSSDENMPDLLPERLEAGTLNTPAIVSIKAGLEYIENVTQEFIEYRLRILTSKLAERLRCINDIEIFGDENGIVSFRIKNHPCSRIEKALNDEKICARSGLQCSPLAHKTLNTLGTGLIRLSLSIFNNENEIDQVYKVISNYIKK